MKIRLIKFAPINYVNHPAGWVGVVDDKLGQSIINNGRAVRVDAPAKEPEPEEAESPPKRGRGRPKKYV